MYVMLGGAIGSAARYASMSLLGKVSGNDFPYGTLFVNIFGSFLMGVWIAYMANLLPERGKNLHLLFAVGVLGGFTTFSTFSLDVFYLFERGAYPQMLAYVLGSVIISLLALMLGMYLVRLATA
jgi:CrcB protein